MNDIMVETPYVFPACAGKRRNPAVDRDMRSLLKKNGSGIYARAFIAPQPYDDLTGPENALRNGTIFNSLYMPYRPAEGECMCCEKGGAKV